MGPEPGKGRRGRVRLTGACWLVFMALASALAWTPAFIDHHTSISFSPESTRRVILSVTFSSGRCWSELKPFTSGMGASFGGAQT